jgi:hypothetical protein
MCSQHQQEWNLNAEIMTQFTQLVSDADNAYRANLNKESKNHLTATAKNTAFLSLRLFLRCSLRR